MLHKRVLDKAHPTFEKLLPWYTERFPEGRSQGHDKQLYGHHCEVKCHNSLFFRSIFAVCDVYNNLPQHVVDLQLMIFNVISPKSRKCVVNKGLKHGLLLFADDPNGR